MTAVELAWMRLAAQQGVPLWKVKRITPYSEFLLWRAKWEIDEETEFKTISKLDYYLAQIAREVRVVLYRRADANKISLKDFILKFSFTGKSTAKTPPPKKSNIPTQEEVEKRTILSKSFWFALLGLKRKDKETGNGTPDRSRRIGGSGNR